MKEFQKKIKTVVKRHTPDKEQIRRAVKGEVSAAVTASKAERSFSVGSLAAVAVMFILFVGIVVGSVLVEQTRKPAVSGIGSSDNETIRNSDTETTNTTLPDPDEETDRVGENAVPLSYRIDTETPLMENPTPWETVRDGILNGDIITDTEREYVAASNLKNVTTQAFYDQTGYEIFTPTYSLYGIYLYDGKGVYTVTSDYIQGCPVVLKHGETYGMLMASAWGSGIIRSQVFYYDFVTKSTVTLFIHSSLLPDDEVINQRFQENERVNADYELPDGIPYILPEYYRRLSVEPVYHENGDLSVRVFAMVHDGYELDPYKDVLLVSYKSVWIGTLRYSAENKTWDYEPKETPEPVTTEAGDDTVTPEPLETEESLVYTDNSIYVGYCSDEIGREKLWELSVSRRDESDYPAYLFRDAASLLSFYEDTKDYLFYGSPSYSSINFGDLLATYNDTFFSNETLVIVYLPMNGDSYSVAAESVSLRSGRLTISVNKSVRGDEMDTMMSGYFVLIEIKGGLEGLHEICVKDVSERGSVADLIPETVQPESLPSVDVTLIEVKPIETITVSYTVDGGIYRSYSSAEKTARVADLLNGLAIRDTTEEPPVKYGRTLAITVSYTDGTSATLYQFDEYLRIDGGALYKFLDYNDVAAFENFFYYNESDARN